MAITQHPGREVVAIEFDIDIGFGPNVQLVFTDVPGDYAFINFTESGSPYSIHSLVAPTIARFDDIPYSTDAGPGGTAQVFVP